jgi:hypothetical protein
LTGFFFVLPATLLVVGLVAYPFCYALLLSLTAKQAGVPGHLVGFRNFANLFVGDIFLQAIRNSFVFTGIAVACKRILAVEVLSAPLAGFPLGPDGPIPLTTKEIQNLGQFFAALDLRRFVDPAGFRARMDRMIREIQALPVVPGFAEMLVAGEPEARCRRQGLKNGIPLTAEAIQILRDYGFTEGETPC